MDDGTNRFNPKCFKVFWRKKIFLNSSARALSCVHPTDNSPDSSGKNGRRHHPPGRRGRDHHIVDENGDPINPTPGTSGDGDGVDTTLNSGARAATNAIQSEVLRSQSPPPPKYGKRHSPRRAYLTTRVRRRCAHLAAAAAAA